jgi:O-antigen ligase
MVSSFERSRNVAILVCLLGLVPLWNIPHTIAARYLFAGLLLVIVVASNPDWKLFFRKNTILLVLFAYLLVHLIFFSIDFHVALDNFRAEWMLLILFSVLGGGTGLLLPKDKSRTLLLFLAIAFSIPLLIHLGLSVHEGFKRGAIPWAYWGIAGFHDKMGYTAVHATIFSSVFFLYQAKNRLEKTIALILLFACITSPLIASSRGATAFVFFLLVFVFLIHLVINFRVEAGRRKRVFALLSIMLGLIVVGKIGSEADPARWTGIITRLELGLHGDPIEVNCGGIDVLRKTLEDEGRAITPEIEQAMRTVIEGDSARIMTARAALALSLSHPMGVDQSRDAYKIAMSEICKPAILLSHAHNGWIDTALAIGIPGAILYFLVLLNFSRLGFIHIRTGGVARPYAIALFVTSTFWIIRAFIDSTQRNQMLEMQVFTIALLYGFIASYKKQTGE